MSQDKNSIAAKSSLIIRRSPVVVYEAFVQPEKLRHFWLSSASASLAVGQWVVWNFLVAGASVRARAKNLEPGKKIHIEWADGSEVIWEFETYHEDSTIVRVTNFGFSGDHDEILATALESTQGFTLVLAAAKTFLEKGDAMRITADKAELIEHTLKTNEKKN